jgi:hypothetical protein
MHRTASRLARATGLVSFLSLSLAGAALARKPSRLDAETFKLWGGPYAVDCRAPASPTLRIAADALSLHTAAGRTTGHSLQAVFAFFGQTPPPNYQVAITSDLERGAQLTFVVFRDALGPYVMLEGDAKLRKKLGQALFMKPFRSCDPDKIVPPPDGAR